MMRLKPNKIYALGVAVFGFLTFNLMVDSVRAPLQIDLTEGNLFTITDGTKSLLKSLDEPVSLRFYYSEKLATPYPKLYRYGRRVRDVLHAMARASDGKLLLDIVDPAPYSDAEDDAIALGLDGIPLPSGEKIYLGLHGEDATNREANIPFFAEEREAFLEYDLAKMIFGLTQEGRPKLAILSGLPLAIGPDGFQALIEGRGRPYVVYDQLEQFFDIHNLDEVFVDIPTDVDALLVIHPPALSDAQLYAIDQYVVKGGRLLAFVDPLAEQSKNAEAGGGVGGPVPVAQSSSFDRLFDAWGIVFTKDQVVGDFENALPINVGGYGPRAVRDYIPWMMASKDQLNSTHAITGMLNQLTFMSTGSFSMSDGAALDMTPLVVSSKSSGLLDAADVRGDPDPDALIRAAVADGKQHVLMAEVRGIVKTAFPDGPPEGVTVLEGHQMQSATEQSVILGADVDLFADRFWVEIKDYFGQKVANPFADNGSMIVNAVDFMVGSDALIGLRSRSVSRRPFTLIEGLRKEAESLFLNEEQALQQRLQDTENRIAQLEGLKSGDQAIFSAGQENEIAQFKSDLAQTRRALRSVQANLRADIEALQARLSVFNILVMPLLLILVGIGMSFHRRKRRMKGLSR